MPQELTIRPISWERSDGILLRRWYFRDNPFWVIQRGSTSEHWDSAQEGWVSCNSEAEVRAIGMPYAKARKVFREIPEV